ncbi:MAG: hypothetical protein R3C11_14560 [Planctomycetaceae bacterium]
MNRFLLSKFCLVLVLSAPIALKAAVPDIKAFVPMGGKAGTTVDVKVEGISDKDPAPAIWCSREDLQIAAGEKPNQLKITIPENATPGLAWIRLHNAEGASNLRPFEVGHITEITETESNNTLETATELKEESMTVNGVLGSGSDVDVFKMHLEPGQTVVANLQANSRMGSPMDGVMQVVSPRGFVLRQHDDDLGFDPMAVYTTAEAGEYYIRLFSFPSTPNQSIAFSGANTYVYRMLVTTGPYVDHTTPMSLSTAEPTSVRLFGWNLPRELHELTLPPEAANSSCSLPAREYSKFT